jgi:hypothetical protein
VTSHRVLDKLELALVELEYAMADYYYGMASLGEIKDIARLTKLQAKLAAANEAVLAAFALVSKAKLTPRPRRRVTLSASTTRELQTSAK